MIVVTLSGPCGSGKSTLIKMLELEFECLPVTYRNSIRKNVAHDPTSYNSKLEYCDTWFNEILFQLQKGKKLILTDRSPFDSAAYLKEKQEYFKNEVLSKFKMTKENGILYVAILVTASYERLVMRIKSRIENGERNDFLTNVELPLLDKSLQFYKNNLSFFDEVIDTTEESLAQSKKKITEFLSSLSYKFNQDQ